MPWQRAATLDDDALSCVQGDFTGSAVVEFGSTRRFMSRDTLGVKRNQSTGDLHPGLLRILGGSFRAALSHAPNAFTIVSGSEKFRAKYPLNGPAA